MLNSAQPIQTEKEYVESLERAVKEYWQQRCKLQQRVGQLEGALTGITCWPEVPSILKDRINGLLQQKPS